MARDILIVDDEADIRMLIAGVLGDEGFTTREAANSVGTLVSVHVIPRPHADLAKHFTTVPGK